MINIEAGTIDNCKEYVNELLKDDNTGHGFDHVMRVYNNAIQIALFEGMTDIDLEVLCLGALLHDVDDPKLFDTKDNYNARKFLNSQKDLNPNKIDKIIEVINGVSFSKNKDKKPKTTEAAIVQDADRLDAIGAIGIMRAVSYSVTHGKTFDDVIEHFYYKLLLIKDRLNTNTAKSIAEARHKLMLDFVNQYAVERMNMVK